MREVRSPICQGKEPIDGEVTYSSWAVGWTFAKPLRLFPERKLLTGQRKSPRAKLKLYLHICCPTNITAYAESCCSVPSINYFINCTTWPASVQPLGKSTWTVFLDLEHLRFELEVNMTKSNWSSHLTASLSANTSLPLFIPHAPRNTCRDTFTKQKIYGGKIFVGNGRSHLCDFS